MSGGKETRWARIVADGATGAADRLALRGLGAMSVLYGVALRLHLGAYQIGLARALRLPVPVISIGNITVGGTGKTTAAIAVARSLAHCGRRVAVLSRGYRGTGERRAVLVSEGAGPAVPPEVAGDEPYLLAVALPGVSVLVGRDRRRTGRLAVERLDADVLLLDDGFQYRRLAKDVEVVLVDALSPFGYDCLVPRGLLREPPASLARAAAIWVTHADLVRQADLRAVRERVRRHAPAARVWETRHAPVRLRRPFDGAELPAEAARGCRVVALSGIGNPLAFERTLEQVGAIPVRHARFDDHHRYEAVEVSHILAAAAAEADMVVTTAKDAVRIPAGCVDERLWVLEVELVEAAGARPASEEMEWLLKATAEA